MAITLPRDISTLSRPDRSLSLQVSIPVVEQLYSIALWDTDLGEVVSAPGVDVTDSTTLVEHFFTVPPKTLNMREPFNTHIQPTQNGGKYVESHGSLIKEVQITGTTGVRPHKKKRPDNVSNNVRIDEGQVPETTRSAAIGLDPTEITGHDTAMSLRNVFRHYSDLQNAGSTSIVMVWRNAKDDDYWVVEPVVHELKQDSGNPFSYNYSIQLKTLARFDKSVLSLPTEARNAGKDCQETLQNQGNVTARLRNIQKVLTNGYFVTMASGNIIGGGLAAVNSILVPLGDVIRGIKGNIQGVYGAADQLLRAADTVATEINSQLRDVAEIAYDADTRRVYRYWRRTLEACYQLLTEPSFKKAYQRVISQRTRISRAYSVPGFTGTSSVPNTGGSPTFLANAPRTSQVAQYIVGAQDDIRSLAGQLLGDSRRWQELVVLNDLKPPYINNVGSQGVLAPGETLLYPQSGQGGTDMIKLQTNAGQDYDAQDSTSLLDQTYGRDIKLVSVSTDISGTLTDLEVNNRGDLSTIVGVPNVDQAIKIKFSTEKGTLRMHPFFGARFALGSKATTKSFNNFRLNTLATLLSDDRIADVKSIKFVTVGDILFVSAQILLVSAKEYRDTHFAVRRF